MDTGQFLMFWFSALTILAIIVYLIVRNLL